MKKFIALAIAVLMLAALAVPAFAQEQDIAENGSGRVEVTYTVGESYSVIIPAAMTMETAADVKVVGHVASAKAISVASENGWKLKKGNDEAEYKLVKIVEQQETTLDTTAAILVSETGDNVNSKVTIKAVWKTSAPQAMGTYTDTLTFTVGNAA